MAFTWQDAAQKLGSTGEYAEERLSNDIGSIRPATIEEVRAMFPGEKFSASESVTYMPLRMCHSLPNRNKRGRGFMPGVLQRSFASARDNLIDLDHMLRDNGRHFREDRVIGHIKTTRFDPEGKWSDIADASGLAIPKEPIPMIALGVLWNRIPEVSKIVDEYVNGKKAWKTSMECGHRLKDDAFLYRGEIIPFTEAEAGMLECVEMASVKPYKDHELTLLLGGKDNLVDFWGLAMTMDPADGDADVLAMIAGQSRELASRKIFHMPLKAHHFDSVEIANSGVDTAIKEIASLTVIGTTEPAVGESDGHVHEVLSDMTILPAANHTHYPSSLQIVQGTTPYLTGKTDSSYRHVKSSVNGMETMGESFVHMHLLKINLRKKPKSSDDESGDAEIASLNTPLSGDVEMNLQQFLERAEKLLKVSSGNQATLPADVQGEIASLSEGLRQMNQEKLIKDAVQKEIADLTAAGTIVPKEAADKAVADAVKAEADKHAAEEALRVKRDERRKKITELGLNLEASLEDEAETIGAQIDAIGADESGDKEFARTLSMLKQVAAAAKQAAKPAEVQVAGQADETEEGTKVLRAAANAGGAKKKQPLLAGGVSEEVREAASAGDGQPKIVGRKALLTALKK